MAVVVVTQLPRIGWLNGGEGSTSSKLSYITRAFVNRTIMMTIVTSFPLLVQSHHHIHPLPNHHFPLLFCLPIYLKL